jgi:hypothetical protein
MATTDEKIAFEPQQDMAVLGDDNSLKGSTLEDREVFKKSVEGVDYRTVTWQRAIIIFIKTQIATGVLGIPSALHTLGAVGGGLCIVGYQALNCCMLSIKILSLAGIFTDEDVFGIDTTIIAGNFRNNHPECHSKSQKLAPALEIISCPFVAAFVVRQ